MKKILSLLLGSLLLLSGCGEEEVTKQKDEYTHLMPQTVTGKIVATKEEKEEVKKFKLNESVLKNQDAYVQKFNIEENEFKITKFFQKDTGKLVYLVSGVTFKASDMIDADANQPITQNFLKSIEIVEVKELKTTTFFFEDQDNGNILSITQGKGYGGTLTVQPPKR